MKTKTRRKKTNYAPTKSDPICKWRNASVATIVELVGYLPKKQMPHDLFRDYMRNVYEGDFFHTAYQLAAQLGLYYEDDSVYIPRFDHDITPNEAISYMRKWMTRYYVPNPFTKRGFVGIYPLVNLHNGFADYLNNHPSKPNLATAGAALFGGEMGNILCVKYILNEYSDIIEVDKDFNMKLTNTQYGRVDVYNDRDDKKAFFDTFI